MLPIPSIFLPSSPPKHRMARLAISALSGQLLIASVRRSRISIICFRASVLSFLIRTATTSRPSRYTFPLLGTGIPHAYSTVVISSIGVPVFISSFYFIFQRRIFSLQYRGGSWYIRNFSIFTTLPALRWASTITHPPEPFQRYNRISSQFSFNRDAP